MSLSEEDQANVKVFLHDPALIRRSADEYFDSLPPEQVEVRTIRAEHGQVEH